MAEVLLKFGVILAVILMSFASSFYALFRDVDSFYQTSLNLFMTMLGDVALFDELEENSSREEYASVGRLLLVAFVIIVTIMLLNLLIAILTTAHADVHSNMEREFKVSTARTVQHYRLVVELDILPAPFNALQTLVILPYIATGKQHSNSCRQVKRAVGHVVFWLTLGPTAVVAGAILLVASLLQIISLSIEYRKIYRNVSLVFIACGFFCLYLDGPLFLIVMWVKEPFLWVMRVFEFLSKESTPTVEQESLAVDVQKMLKDAGVSASDLRTYLENPMIDPDVRRDEVDRTTTIEHMKLLRDHLKEETEIRFNRLHETVKTLSANRESRVSEIRDDIATTNRRVSELGDSMNNRFATTDRRVSKLRDEMNEKFAKIINILEA